MKRGALQIAPMAYAPLARIASLPAIYVDANKAVFRDDVMHALVAFYEKHADSQLERKVDLIVYMSWMLVSQSLLWWEKKVLLDDMHNYWTGDDIMDLTETDYYHARLVRIHLTKRVSRKRKRSVVEPS